MSFEITPGTIYSAFFPFSDLSVSKKCPVLALGSLDGHGDVRVAFITRTPVAEESGFELTPDDYDGAPLPFTSNLRADKTYFRLELGTVKLPLLRFAHH